MSKSSPNRRTASAISYHPSILTGTALALVSSSWVFFLQLYLPPGAPFLPWALVGAAFALLAVRAFFREDLFPLASLRRPAWTAALGLAVCAVGFAVFPYPYSAGLVPLGLGWAGLALAGRWTVPRRLSGALAQTGLALAVSAAALPLLLGWAARTHELGFPGRLLAHLLAGMLRAAGHAAEALPSGAVFLRTYDDYLTLPVTAERLLPLPMLLFALLWSLWLLRSRGRLESLVRFWAILLGFALLRLAGLTLVVVQRVDLAWFWQPWVLTLSLLPLAWLVREPARQASSAATEKPVGQTFLSVKKSSASTRQTGMSDLPLLSKLVPALGFLGAALAVIAFTFHDPGASKSGRLLINEHGSDWEWTTDTLNTEIYNEKTTYNFWCLARYLEYYYDLRTNHEPLSPQVLEGVDVLVLKIPTQPYAPEEIEAVVDFVRRGGGLWVIGDHTNVFGSSTFFNPLLRRFGCNLDYSSTHDLASGNLSLYRRPERFAHPSVVNMPDYLFATSCAIRAPLTADAAILGYGLRADHLDYSQKNFFANRDRKQFGIHFGLFLQQAALRYGKGRLLIYTDSTCFSNFFIFLRGKPELVLGSLEWLNRSPRYAWVRPLALVLALICLAALVLLKARGPLLLAALILGAALAGWASDRAARSAYPLPENVRPVPWVNFERDHCRYFLPTLRLAQDGDKDYLTFFVWTQRVGAVPREVYRFEDCLEGRDPLVMMEPGTDLDAGENAALRRWVEEGGRLLVINSADNASAAPHRLLESFGLRLKTTVGSADSSHTLTLAGRFFPLVVGGRFSSLHGGRAFLESDQREVIGVVKEVGKGKVYALSCGHLFRNSSMGQTAVIPDEGLKEFYKIEFRLIRDLLGWETEPPGGQPDQAVAAAPRSAQ
ncbi:MAG: hypothetical protein C4524_00930 [Candidatus Zixiibacteriota bacterium]|nr:MAG: hypothetical protein C4524_00930 [candidate division Zixibacteria bacterium]